MSGQGVFGRGRVLAWAAAVALLAALVVAPGARAEAGWSFDHESWDFGVVAPGDGPTAPKEFTLTNDGDVELSPVFVSIGGSGGSGFAIAENGCGKLGPGDGCAISVSFDPSTAGPKVGQLSVGSLDGVPPASVELSGRGAGPIVSIDPPSQTFDPLEVEMGASGAKRFTVRNDGELDLAIASISIVDFYATGPSQFSLAGGTCADGTILPPAGACTVDVTFAPTVPGLLNSQLRIVDNAPGAPHVATVEGFGIARPFALPAPPVLAPPWVAFFHRPARQTRKRRAVFRFRGSANAARFVCRLDRGQLHPCGSPVRYRRLRRGRHRFAVRALDGNGRSGPVRVIHWRVLRG